MGFVENEERWLAMPLGEVLQWLREQTEDKWDASMDAEGEAKGKAAAEYERVESLQGSLARVVAWLACMQPPQVSCELPGGAYEVGEAARRARGRVCVKCRRQIRQTSELMTICPVQMPGLPIHVSCFKEMEEEFGGRM